MSNLLLDQDLSTDERAAVMTALCSEVATDGRTFAADVGPDWFREVVDDEEEQMTRLMMFMLTYFPADFVTWEPINDAFFTFLEFVPKGMVWLPAQHGKSTMLSRFMVWMMIREPNISMIYTEKTESTAWKRSRALRSILEQNRLLQKHYGAFKPERTDGIRSWSDHAMTIRQRTEIIDTPTLSAFGAGGSSLLGNRCNVALIDDPVTHENSTSELERDKLYAWYSEAVATSPYPLPIKVQRYLVKLFLIGTVFRRDDLFHRLLPMVEAGEYQHLWMKAVDSETTGATLSPRFTFIAPEILEKRSLSNPEYGDLLQKVRHGEVTNLYSYMRRSGRIHFNRRYQNIAIDEESQFVKEEWIKGGPGEDAPNGGYTGCLDKDRNIGSPEPEWICVSGVDPVAGSGSRLSKNFGLVTIACDPREPEVIYLVDLENGNHPLVSDNPARTTQVGLVLKHAIDYKSRIVVEQNAQQKGWQDAIRMVARQKGIVVAPTGHFTGKQKTDPEIGVRAMAPMFENGYFRFPYGNKQSVRKCDLLIDELVYWGNHPTSDLVMALWFAWTKLEKILKSRSEGRPTAAVEKSYINRLTTYAFPPHWTKDQREAWAAGESSEEVA